MFPNIFKVNEQIKRLLVIQISLCNQICKWIGFRLVIICNVPSSYLACIYWEMGTGWNEMIASSASKFLLIVIASMAVHVAYYHE